MKKHVLSALFVIVGSISGYSQFNENGYKQLELGIDKTEANKIVAFKQSDDYPKVVCDGIELELTFVELDKPILFSVKTSSPNAKIEGVSENLIGKKHKEIKEILGGKLVAFNDDSGPNAKYHIYYKDKNAENNYLSSCVLEFDENRTLTSIFSAYNP